MGLQAISVDVKLRPGATPGLEADVFFRQVTSQWLPQFFTPRELRGFVDRTPVSYDLKAGQQWRGTDLWQGEEVDNFPLSRIVPEFSVFKTVLPVRQMELQFYGGLHHEPPFPGSTRGWYGRIVSYGAGASIPWLSFMVTVRVDWNDLGRGVRVSFPFAGYPLTSVQPQLKEPAVVQLTSSNELLDSNRQTLLSIFRQLPQVLGTGPEDIIYKVESDRVLFLSDRDALREWESCLTK